MREGHTGAARASWTRRSRRPRRLRFRAALAGLVTTLLVVTGSVAITTAPAFADDINATLGLSKSTEDTTPPLGEVSPGEIFSYQLSFSCGTSVPGVTGCKTATIVDLLPEWLEYVSISSFPSFAPGTSTVTDVGGRDQVEIVFTAPINTPLPTTGLPLGAGEITVQVRLAADAPWELNGTTLTNTADITAENAEAKTSDSTVIAIVPTQLSTTASKVFTPAQNYNFPGETTQLTIAATNTTNGGVDTMTVQDPAGVAPLPTDASNPFFYLEFTDFATGSLPAGADAVTAEVYSALDDTWYTVYSGAGPPVYPAAGPGVPDKADIFGVRFTYDDTDGSRISRDASASNAVLLTQRANVAGLPTTTLSNTVQSTVTLGADTAVSPVVTRPYQIISFGLDITASKSFSPDQIKAGESTTVAIGATNSGTAVMSQMVITEPGVATPGALSGDLIFDGFGTVAGGAGAGIQWPAGATGASIVYQYVGGGSSAPLSTTTANTIPVSPIGDRVIGFEITFTGTITAGAEARTPFVVDTQRVGTPPDLTTVTNDVDVEGAAAANPALTITDTATDSVDIFGDRLAVEVSKSIQPSQSWLVPGQQTVAQIPATVAAFPDTTVNATQVIVDDSAVLSADWWNLYNATELPQLGVPANATLTVQYTTNGTTFTDLPGAVDLDSPPSYQTVSISSGLQDTITGLRFIYNAKSGESFDPGSTFQPNITFVTRTTTRTGGIPIENVTPNATIPDPANPGSTIPVVQIENCADAEGSAPLLTSTTVVTDPCPVSTLVPVSGGGGGGISPDLVDKDLSPVTVVERSQGSTSGTLDWSTGGLTGVTQMRVTETGSTGFAPATSANLATSFFNAFDVTRLQPITKTSDPLIAYDRIASIELYDYLMGTWTAIAGGPWDGPTSGNTVFPGYNLTTAERLTTTGVRYTFEESPNRASVLTPGDLNQPAVGSGVAASTDRRPITMAFQLRDDRRSDGTPVLYNQLYNTAPDLNVVTNTVNAQACLTAFVGDTCATGYSTNDSDTITILNGTANITTTKSWSSGVSGGGALGIPPSSTPAEDYPTTRMTLRVANNGPQKVDTLGLEDPAPNVAFAGSTFDVFTLTDIVTISPPKDTAGTEGNADVEVFLDLFGGGTTGPLTVSAALALTSADLVDVIGVRAYASGRISVSSGNNDGRLEIVMDAQLRERLRSDPATPVSAGAVPNTIFGSIGDPSVETSGACSVSSPPVTPDPNTVISCNSASVTLAANQDRTVTANKSFSPSFEYETTNDRIRMLLSGQPGGNARSNQVVITDTAAGYWNAYAFAGLVDANPNRFGITSPANRVQVELFRGATYTVEPDNSITVTGGTWNTVVRTNGDQWMTAAQARSALPPGAATATAPILGGGTVTYGDVQGVRLTYQRVASTDISDPAAALLLFENPANPTLTANIFMQRRADLLTGGPVPTTLSGNIAAPGTTSAGVYPNSVTADATGIAGNGSPASNTHSANFTYRHQPTEATLVKTPTGQVQPGSNFQVAITTTNSGDYPIIDPVITDNLPVGGVSAGLPDFVFPAGADPTDPANYTFALSSGTAPGSPWTELPIDPADVTVDVTYSAGPDPEPIAIGFEFPADSALGIGQVYRISWDMRLRPGALASQTFVNQFEITGERDFDVCNGTSGTTDVCSTTAQVSTQPLANLGMFQEVRALDPSLGVVSTDATACTTSDASADGFYVAPCAPVTKPGTNNEWRLHFQNLGSYALDQVSTIIYLPNAGLSGIDIPSALTQWRPTLVDNTGPALRADATPTATRTVYYSTVTPGTSLCDSILEPGGSCPAGYWQPLVAGVDPSTVTALYVVIDFLGGGDLLQPGEEFQLSFQTEVPPAAFNPGTDPIAWNSAKAGGKYTAGTQRTLPPFEVPVVPAALATGSLELEKTVDGDGAGESWVPTSFSGVLQCESVGVPVPSSAIPSVPALVAGDPPITVSGLPWGAECAFVEDDAGSAVTITPATVTVTSDPGSIELQSITNTYLLGGFTVTKTVDNSGAQNQSGTPISYGDREFAFDATCTFLGQEVLDAADQSFTLQDGETRTILGLPAGAECTVEETDIQDAADTTIVVTEDGTAGPTVNGTTTDPFDILPYETGTTTVKTSVAYLNTYTVGAVTVTKALDGDGEALWGDSNFTVSMVCTLDDVTPNPVWTGTTMLNRLNPTWTVSNLPTGAECVATETAEGGANSTTGSTAIIVGDDPSTPDVGTITNTFTVGSLTVTKALDGEPAASLAPATGFDYEVSLQCTREVNGATLAVAIPGGATRTITGAGVATYNDLPTGAECVVTETEEGFATGHTISPAGPVTIGDVSTPVSVTVTNEFANGEISITKTVDAPVGFPVPTSFTATATCTWNGAAVPLPAGGVVTLTAGVPVVLTDIPVGSECSVVEDDIGQVSSTVTPSSLTVTDDIQTFEFDIENVYEWASLLVEKTVIVPDPPGTTFPVPTGFAFTAVCTFLGDEVLNETFTLDDGGSRLFDDLPARSECVVTETDPRDADATVTSVEVITPTVPPSVDTPAREATIPELSPDTAGGDTQNTVSYENLYDLVGLTITKDLEGEGAAQFGENQTFTVAIVCTFAGETLVNTTVDLNAGNAWTASVTGLIAGSECTVTEPDLEGADAVVVTPNNGTNTDIGVILLPDTGVATMTVTNWYLTGSLDVTKVFDGLAAAQYGTVDFDLELACVRDGIDVDIPGGNERVVSATIPTAEWTHLPTGADCTLTETSTGGAGSTAILDASGAPLVPPVTDATAGYTFTVVTDPTILSVTDQPQPALQVQNTFNYAEVSVSKTVQTDAQDNNGDPVGFGPFEVTLQCDFLGAPVTANEPMAQVIADGDTVTWTGLPEGADCAIEETGTADASTTSFAITQAGVTDPAEEGTIAVLDPLPADVATDQTSVEFINFYPVDPLIIRKELTGSGSGEVVRSFPVHVVCVLIDSSHPAPGLLVRDVMVEIGGPSNLAPEIDHLPIGSTCTITETDTGGATSVSITVTPYSGGAPGTGTPGTPTTVNGPSITVTLVEQWNDAVITNEFIKPLPPTGGVMAWTVPIGSALIVVLGILFVMWRRLEPRRQ